MRKQLHAIHLKFRGPVHFGSKKSDYGQSETQLHSDTLYSAIFQTWAMIGKEEWIPTKEKPEFGFAISSAFPFFYDGKEHQHFFPKPYGQLFKKDKNKEAIFVEHRKKIKKIAYLHRDAFYEWCEKGEIDIDTSLLKGQFYAKSLPKDEEGNPIKLVDTDVVPRVKVSREEGEDATPFAMDRMYFYDKEGQHSGLYFLFHGEEKDLKKVKVALTLLEDEGLGTDRKVGQGQFSFEIVPFKKPHWSGKKSINLSLLLPESQQWVDEHVLNHDLGGYGLIERGGWITTPGHDTYRKKTVHFFEAGSIFKYESQSIQQAGTLKDVYPSESLNGITEQPHPVWRVGKSLLFPVKTD